MAVSLFSGCLAGVISSQKGGSRVFDVHCPDYLGGWVMVGPCWGPGKLSLLSLLISEAQRFQELFVGFTSLSLPLTPYGFSCCHTSWRVPVSVHCGGQVVCGSFRKVSGQRPLRFSSLDPVLFSEGNARKEEGGQRLLRFPEKGWVEVP
jgi:hypothetical protein